MIDRFPCQHAAAAAKSLQLCPTLCDPIDISPPGSPSLGFSRQEHWSGLPFPSPMHESEKVKVKSLSCVRLLATPWTAAYQAPPPMGFSRQEYWSGVPLPSLEYTKHQVLKNNVLQSSLSFPRASVAEALTSGPSFRVYRVLI